MKSFLSICVAALTITWVVGCSSNEPVNSVENADEQAVLDYDAMVEADNAQMEGEDIE